MFNVDAFLPAFSASPGSTPGLNFALGFGAPIPNISIPTFGGGAFLPPTLPTTTATAIAPTAAAAPVVYSTGAPGSTSQTPLPGVDPRIARLIELAQYLRALLAQREAQRTARRQQARSVAAWRDYFSRLQAQANAAAAAERTTMALSDAYSLSPLPSGAFPSGGNGGGGGLVESLLSALGGIGGSIAQERALREARRLASLQLAPMVPSAAAGAGALLGSLLGGQPGALEEGGMLERFESDIEREAVLFTRPSTTVRPVPVINARHPTTGNLVAWKYAGRPVLYSGDLAACKRVNRVASRVARAVGRGRGRTRTVTRTRTVRPRRRR